jgi:hypothetical protein
MNSTLEGATSRPALRPEGIGLATYRAVGFAKPKAEQRFMVPTISASQATRRATIPADSGLFPRRSRHFLIG